MTYTMHLEPENLSHKQALAAKMPTEITFGPRHPIGNLLYGTNHAKNGSPRWKKKRNSALPHTTSHLKLSLECRIGQDYGAISKTKADLDL